MIAVAVDEFPDIWHDLEQCGYCSNEVFLMSQWMNRKYSPERVARFAQKGTFYKLNQETVYRKENIAGEQTIYGNIFGGGGQW